jgi:2-polyprenyl-6-hydroxyphenyl methylase/3-demethylubiquinone-9 3-methyltransferase
VVVRADRVRNDLRLYEDLRGEWWRPAGEFAMLHWLAAARAELVPPAGRPGAVLVDLGCGAGLLAPHLAGLGYRHVGVDLVGSALRQAAGHGVAPVRGDAYRVPVRSGSADVVSAGELLEHVTEPARVIGEAARLLRPGGVLVADTIADTALARFVAVTVAERVPGLAPALIHDPALFVSPGAAVDACRRHGLRPTVRGIRPAAGQLLRFLVTRRGSVRLVATRSTGILYQLTAVKPHD